MRDIRANIKSFLKRNDADNRIKPWIRWYSRIGFSAKGSVYVLIGIISMMTAVGISGKSGQQGAIEAIASKPFGELIIWLVVLGITGYITWLVTQVIIEPDYKGTTIIGIFIRIGYFFSATFHVGLGIKFAIIAINSGQTGNSKQFWMGKIIDMPIGRLAVGVAGLSIFTFAIIQVINGFRGSYLKELKTNEMGRKGWLALNIIGKIGFIARGITFGVLGGFLIHSGWTAESSKATGIDGALAQIAQEPYGQLLLGILSLGLFLYGVFTVFEGKERDIQVKKD